MSQDPVLRGARIRQFLEDEAVIWALGELRKENYAMFRTAATPHDLLAAQARGQVLEMFEATMRAVVDVGEVEEHRREHDAQDVTVR